MSSSPTQPKFTSQGEGVNFPPEDDAEGHAFRAAADGDGDQPEGFRAAAFPEGDEDDVEGHRRLVMADGGEDDTEGHASSFVDGRPGGQPEPMEPVPSEDGVRAAADGEDAEGHQLRYYADGPKPQDGPDGLRSLADADEDDTEGHLRVLADDDGKDGFAAR